MKTDKQNGLIRGTWLDLDESLAKNGLMGLNLSKTEPFELTVSFAIYPRRWGFIGLECVHTNGFLEGCTASVSGRAVNVIRTDVQYETVEEIVDSTRTERIEHEVNVSAKPSIKRKKDTSTKESQKTKKCRRSVTFCEFAKGENPVWIFKASPEAQPPLLDGAYCIRLALEFKSSPPTAAGIFSAESLRHVRITDKQGRDVSWLRYWLVVAKLKRHIHPNVVKISFRV